MAEEIPSTMKSGASKRLSSDMENQDSSEQNKRGKGPLMPPDSSLWVCRNPACRAIQSTVPRFCKRCSCFICSRFDNSTDRSLWLRCTPDSGSEFCCGFSCHVECALRHGRVGAPVQLDGCYNCPSCSKVSTVIGCWKKQLKIALATNRIDVLCYRIFLSYQLLSGTSRFRELHKFVEDLKATIEMEVGPIHEAMGKTTRTHFGQLRAISHVQALCKLAIRKAEEFLPPQHPTSALNTNVASGSGSGVVQPETPQQEGLPLPDLNVEFQEADAKPSTDDALESIVRAICGLQHGGHVTKEFRLKFLTWFSLKATEHECKVVRTFVRTMIDDPSGLAGQLLHTFSDMISITRP